MVENMSVLGSSPRDDTKFIVNGSKVDPEDMISSIGPNRHIDPSHSTASLRRIESPTVRSPNPSEARVISPPNLGSNSVSPRDVGSSVRSPSIEHSQTPGSGVPRSNPVPLMPIVQPMRDLRQSIPRTYITPSSSNQYTPRGRSDNFRDERVIHNQYIPQQRVNQYTPQDRLVRSNHTTHGSSRSQPVSDRYNGYTPRDRDDSSRSAHSARSTEYNSPIAYLTPRQSDRHRIQSVPRRYDVNQKTTSYVKSYDEFMQRMTPDHVPEQPSDGIRVVYKIRRRDLKILNKIRMDKQKIADSFESVGDHIAKHELILKINHYAQLYKTCPIPPVSVDMPLQDLQRVVTTCEINIEATRAAATYSTYLQKAFGIIEFVMTKFMKIDISGYAQDQMKQMEQYTDLLYQFSQKRVSIKAIKKKQEVSPMKVLLYSIGINTGLFILAKLFLPSVAMSLNVVGDVRRGVGGALTGAITGASTGSDLGSIFNQVMPFLGMLGVPQANAQPAPTAPQVNTQVNQPQTNTQGSNDQQPRARRVPSY